MFLCFVWQRSLKDHEEFNGNNLVNIKLSATEDGMPVKKRFRKAHNDTQNCTEKVIPLPPPLINMSDFIHSNFEETEKNVKRKYCGNYQIFLYQSYNPLTVIVYSINCWKKNKYFFIPNFTKLSHNVKKKLLFY